MPIQRWFVPFLAIGMAIEGSLCLGMLATTHLFHWPPHASSDLKGSILMVALGAMGWAFALIFGSVPSGRETVIDRDKNEVRHVIHRALGPSKVTVTPLGKIERVAVFHGGLGFSKYWYVDLVRPAADGGHVRLAALVKTPPYTKVPASVQNDVARIAELLDLPHSHPTETR